MPSEHFVISMRTGYLTIHCFVTGQKRILAIKMNLDKVKDFTLFNIMLHEELRR